MTAAVFPPLPSVGALVVDEPVWSYPSAVPSGGYAHLRAWVVPTGGHIALVTDQGLGTSVTNAAEHIWTALVTEFGEPLWMLEHYTPRENVPDDGDTVDQVVLVDGEAEWLRIWPRNPDIDGYDQVVAWMRDHGFRMLTR